MASKRRIYMWRKNIHMFYHRNELKRNYRILKSGSYDGLVKCGEQIIHLAIRDGDVEDIDFSQLDFFLTHIEFYNSSGLYKGILVVKDYFEDNRYGSTIVDMEYVLPEGMEMDVTIRELENMIETYLDGIYIGAGDIKVKYI